MTTQQLAEMVILPLRKPDRPIQIAVGGVAVFDIQISDKSILLCGQIDPYGSIRSRIKTPFYTAIEGQNGR